MSDTRSLAGLTVAVTGPPTKGGRLAAELERLGAAVIVAPALRLVPPVDPRPLHRAAARLGEFDWVVLTSAAGVEALAAAAVRADGAAPRRLAVVGSRTAEAAARAGWAAELIPHRFDAEGLLEAFDQRGIALPGARVLVAVAADARAVLPEGLRARGAAVERVSAYDAVPSGSAELSSLAAALEAGSLDLLAFTSSSAARNVLAALGVGVLAVPAAAVGSVTARTARELGYAVAAVAEEHTTDGLVRAVTRWWTSR